MNLFKSSLALFVGILISIFTIANYAQESPAGIYKMRCSACHGVAGKPTAIGTKMGARAYSSPEVAGMANADLLNIIKNGRNKMPAFKESLTDAQINELIKYIRTLK